MNGFRLLSPFSTGIKTPNGWDGYVRRDVTGLPLVL